jgi:hypothetical protein
MRRLEIIGVLANGRLEGGSLASVHSAILKIRIFPALLSPDDRRFLAFGFFFLNQLISR